MKAQMKNATTQQAKDARARDFSRTAAAVRAFIGTFFVVVSIGVAETQAKADSAARFPYWGIGVFGSAATQFPTNALTAIQGYEPFPAALGEYAGLTAEAGLEALHRLSPVWEIAAQAGYGAFSATVAGDETITTNVLVPGTNRLQTVRATLRNTIAANVAILSFSPFVRAYIGEYFFLGAGARFELPFQPQFRYFAELSPATPGVFVQNFTRQIDVELPEQPAARAGVTWSPILAVGGLFPLGERVRLRAELQAQPLFQAFRGFAAERAEWNAPTARLQFALAWTTPPRAPIAPENPKQENPKQENPKQENPKNELSQTREQAQTASAVAAFPQTVRIDTAFQRDTATRLVAWSEPETVRLESRAVELVKTETGAQTAKVTEWYARFLPKPKPFLVAGLDVQFVPAPNAPASAARRKSAQLEEKKTTIRVLESVRRNGSAQRFVKERFDTTRIVRMPIVRFLPNASGENGVKEKILYIRASGGASDLSAAFISADESAPRVDWDAQSLVFSTMTRPQAFGGEEREIVGEIFAWLEAFDNASQKAASDTARITFESAAPTRAESASESRLSGARAKPQAAARWTLAELPLTLARGEDANAQVSFAWSESAAPIAETLAREYGGNDKSAAARSRVVFAMLPAHSAAAIVEEARNFTRKFAAALKASWHIKFFASGGGEISSETSSEISSTTDKRAEPCIRVMIEE